MYVTVGVGAGVGVGDGGTDLLGDGLGVAEWLSVLLGEAVEVGVGVPAGENEDEAAAGGVDPEQAETAAEVSMVMVLQPMTANLALRLVAALVVRTFMKPPRTSPQVAACPARRLEPAPEGTPRCATKGSSPKTATAIKVRPTDNADNR